MSRVSVGMSVSTLIGFARYYDESGKYHSHDPNATTTSYSCSRGHTWQKAKMRPCPTRSCDYGRSE